MGTELVSYERRILARQLLECAKRVDYCGPWVAHKLDDKVIRQQADRANQVFHNCVYLALLGSDVELDAVNLLLVTAALKVVSVGWITIGELAIELERYTVMPTARRERWVGPVTLAVLTAIPAIPVLIGLLP